MRIWTGGFLTVQLALAMILFAQVAVASYIANQDIPTDANINTTDVVTGSITLPAASYPTADRRREFFARLEERLRARSEIVASSRATLLPGDQSGPRRLQVRGQEQPQGGTTPTVLTIETAPGYFETLALGVLRGRDFTALDGNRRQRRRDRQRALRGGLPERRRSDEHAGGGQPRQPATRPAQPQWLTVIGVVPTIRQHVRWRGSRRSSTFRLPHRRRPRHRSWSGIASIRKPRPACCAPRRRPSIRMCALYRMRTLKQAVRDAQWNRHTSAVLADTVTFMSVLLAIVGLYAVTAQRVTLKTREIGLRMALGARSLQVASVIIARAAGAAAAGIPARHRRLDGLGRCVLIGRGRRVYERAANAVEGRGISYAVRDRVVRDPDPPRHDDEPHRRPPPRLAIR